MTPSHPSFIGFSIKQLLNKKGWVDIPSSGSSMFPLIREGDICRFIPFDNRLQKGDIILYLSEMGHLVGHRFHHSYIENEVQYHIFKGDTNYLPDPPVKDNQLIGKLSLIKKRRIHLQLEGLFARWWGSVIFILPGLPHICKKFTRTKDMLGIGTKRRNHA